ncbi:RxLR effector protein [Phytophthora megakarya]|uniref:RxLR effector protein n=1 Tax=Phytophthora megakarya TaxID=4795 RepID=A0A225V9V3_9STRA|nr:RxLR effector protein [Phytophthora megakarya]
MQYLGSTATSAIESFGFIRLTPKNKPLDLLKTLKLDKFDKIDDILVQKSLQFDALGNYVKEYKRLTGQEANVAELFTKKFGVENYAQMLTKAKENTKTAAAATALQDDLLQQMLKNGDKPDDVAKLLGLGRGQQMTRNVNTEALIKYTRDFHNQNRIPAIPDPKKGTAPLKVFKDQKLNSIDDFASNLKTLDDMDNYLVQFAKLHPNKDTPTMTKLFLDGAGDEKLTALIIKAKQSAKEKPEIAAFAEKLQKEQLNQYLAKMEPQEKVYSLLGLTKSKNPTTHVNAQTWVSYKNTFKKMYPHPASSKMTPAQIFDHVKLGKVDDFVTHPKQLQYMDDYMTQFAAKHPGKGSPTLVSLYSSKIGDEKLAKMLVAATKNKETNSLASDMQKLQLSQILMSEKPIAPNTILAWMGGKSNLAGTSLTNWNRYNEQYTALYVK